MSGKDGVFCDPVPNECHEKRIVCLTPAASFLGAKTLTVKSFGQLATCQISGGTGCTFEFAAAATPLVTRVVPEWVLAPTQIDVYGDRFTNGDVSEGRFDFTMHIGDEERCELQGDVQGSTFKCNVAPMYAGTHKMTVIMGDSGKASWANKAATIAVYPSISGVSPAVGSVEGGQLITVLGSSFSKELTDNIITVNGRPAGAGVTRLMPVGGSDMMLRLDLVSSDGLPTPAPLSPCVEQWSPKEFYFNNSITSNFASSHEKLIRMFDNADRFLLGFDPYGGFIMTVNVWLLLALSIAVLIALLLSLLRARGSYTLSVVRLCCVAALVSHLQVRSCSSFT